MKNPLLITIVTMLIWSACKRDEKKEPEVHYSYLSAEQRNKTPYFNNPAFDTLTFLSNKGDTLIFAKLKTDSFFIMTGGRPFPDHPGIYTYHQTLRNTYQTLKGNGKFEVSQERKGVSSVFYFNFMNSNYQIVDQNIGASFSQSYIQSLVIYGKEYKDINALSQGNKITCYLNSKYGVFYALDSTNNINWLLNN